MFCAVMASAVTAQNLIPNQYVLGGTGTENVTKTIVMDNGDYYLFIASGIYGGISYFNNMGVPNHGAQFFVISKHNQNHDMIWRQSYGGDSVDFISAVQPVADGFIIACSSNSSVSGTKTIASNGNFHVWLQKIDFNGNVVWQKGYYTNNDVYSFGILEIDSNQFMLSTRTLAGISGDKTSFGYSGTDGWIIKFDSSGEFISDYTYGTYEDDFSFGLVGTFTNGDILLSTGSYSGASGDKTEDNYGPASNMWFLRVSAQTGAIIWDKTIGSAGENGETFGGHVRVLNDTIYMMVGTDGGVSGLRTVPQKGIIDIWFVKLDENANIIEQYAFGGDSYEGSPIFDFEEDGSIIIFSVSNSNISIDKNEDSRGWGDIWLLKIDASGNIITQKTIGGNRNDSAASFDKLQNGNYIVGCNSSSDVSGERTLPHIGLLQTSSDAWILEIDAITLDIVSETALKQSLVLYPNPTNNLINIQFTEPTQLENAMLYDLSGKVVLEQSFAQVLDSQYTLNTEGLAAGVYTLSLQGVGFVKTQQVVVR